MICGIYKITNTNGKVYIGSSIDIIRRLRVHLNHLRRNDHHSPHLQRAWNKCGEDSFVFEVLLYCDEEDLLFFEQRAIDEYKSLDGAFGYNCMPAVRTDLTGTNYEEMCQKKSENNKGFLFGKNNLNAKAVTINGQHYDTIAEAAQALGMNYNLLWSRLKNGIGINKPVIKGNKGKYCHNAKFVVIGGKQYNTIKEAAQALGMNVSVLGKRLQKGISIYKVYSNKGGNNPSAKSVEIEGLYYDTIKEAAQNLGIKYGTVKYRLNSSNFSEYSFNNSLNPINKQIK